MSYQDLFYTCLCSTGLLEKNSTLMAALDLYLVLFSLQYATVYLLQCKYIRQQCYLMIICHTKDMKQFIFG